MFIGSIYKRLCCEHCESQDEAEKNVHSRTCKKNKSSFPFSFFVEGVAYPKNIGGTRTVYIGEMFVYSILYCVGCSVIQTLVQCVTAYLCARFAYKLSKVVEYIVIIVMTIPIVGSLPAEITLSKDLGLYNHIYGMWVMKANFLGMYFLIFLAAFKSISMTYTEAAKIDGASNMSIMLKIIFPLVKNVIFTIILVNFIAYWKDYQTPMIYISAYPTVTYGLFRIIFDSSSSAGMVSVPIRMTASIIVVLPLIILFIIFLYPKTSTARRRRFNVSSFPIIPEMSNI